MVFVITGLAEQYDSKYYFYAMVRFIHVKIVPIVLDIIALLMKDFNHGSNGIWDEKLILIVDCVTMRCCYCSCFEFGVIPFGASCFLFVLSIYFTQLRLEIISLCNGISFCSSHTLLPFCSRFRMCASVSSSTFEIRMGDITPNGWDGMTQFFSLEEHCVRFNSTERWCIAQCDGSSWNSVFSILITIAVCLLYIQQFAWANCTD